jgi:hypothetical protein
VTDGYLRQYDDDLGAALSLVVRDLCSTLGWTQERAESVVWPKAELRRDFVELGGGVEAAGATALWVADAVQDDLLDRPAMRLWPRCPTHGSHPLSLAPEGSPDAAWTCPETGDRVAHLGDL